MGKKTLNISQEMDDNCGQLTFIQIANILRISPYKVKKIEEQSLNKIRKNKKLFEKLRYYCFD